jgi:vacuolar-type H+-ATPase subunit F/Vma7
MHSGTELVVVAPDAVADGYRLAGARTLVASDANAAVDAVSHAASTAALIAVHASLWEQVPAAVRDGWDRRRMPLILAVPDEDSDAGALKDEALRDLLSRAVGYQITFEPSGGNGP